MLVGFIAGVFGGGSASSIRSTASPNDDEVVGGVAEAIDGAARAGRPSNIASHSAVSRWDVTIIEVRFVCSRKVGSLVFSCWLRDGPLSRSARCGLGRGRNSRNWLRVQVKE